MSAQGDPAPGGAGRIGVLGLGAMGRAMAARLRAAGHRVAAYDPDAAALASFAGGGGTPASSPADAARDCDVLLVVVRDAAQVDEAVFGARGAADALQPGTTVWLASTVAPDFARTLDGRLVERGVHLLDGPVSGGVAGARSGELSVIASGSAAAFAAIAPFAQAVARTIIPVGDAAGLGSAVKMLNQLLAATQIAATAEALNIGLRAGVDPDALYRAVCASSGASRMFASRAPRMAGSHVAEGVPLGIFAKDLGIALAAARQFGCVVPVGLAAERMFRAAMETEGAAGTDTTLLRTYRRLAPAAP